MSLHPGEAGYDPDEVEIKLDDSDRHSRTTMSDADWHSLLARMGENTICHLYLCEATHLALRPNQLYNFTVDPTCALCVALARISAEKGTI